MITFTEPQMAYLLIVPFIVRLLFRSEKGAYGEAIKVPFIKDFAQIEQSQRRFGHQSAALSGLSKAFWLMFAVWCFFVLAAMRPVEVSEPVRVQSQARDILLVTDISTSMQETDFAYQGRRLDRLNAVRAVVSNFVKQRKSDRIGLILFGTRAYLQAPLTFDRQTVSEVLNSMSAGMAGDSTSIGDALGLAVKTLKENNQNTENQIVILLTDGENNDGRLSLPQAIQMAKEEGVKVYTIGVGGKNSLISSFFGIADTPFDERSLQLLADETKGKYFHAADLNGLAQVYRAIDALEPQSMEENFIYPQKELYFYPLSGAILLMILLAFRRRSFGL